MPKLTPKPILGFPTDVDETEIRGYLASQKHITPPAFGWWNIRGSKCDALAALLPCSRIWLKWCAFIPKDCHLVPVKNIYKCKQYWRVEKSIIFNLLWDGKGCILKDCCCQGSLRLRTGVIHQLRPERTAWPACRKTSILFSSCHHKKLQTNTLHLRETIQCIAWD